MIQIYSPGNTDYGKNGDMPIFPTKAEISATLNGTWQLNLEHPIDKTGRWKYIQEDAVVKLPSFNGDQLFRIREKKKASSGITATAEPIFMDSMYDCFLTDIRPTAKNGQEALDIMTAPNAKYSGKSDITKRTTAYYEYKNLIEAINGDDDNSFINRWGGEIIFDNFEITINERVGGDYGVTLQYGKNIQKNGITESVDMTGIVTRIYPKAYNGYKLSGSGYVDSPVINSYPIIKVATITFEDVKMAEDAQEDDKENGITVCSTQAELDTALRKKCNEQFSAGIDKPSVNITADMVLLQNTRQYKNYAVLEQVSLGDTIHCRHAKLGITTDARVISLKYDAIKRKVTYVELGDFTYNYFNNVSSSVDRIDQVIRPDGTVMADKIAGFINGAMASLRAQYDVAKKQDVMAILFENLDESSDLYGAMALGTQGLMISKTRTADGREWDWTTAMTAKGMIANIIVAGTISDKNGLNYWDLESGEFSLSATGFMVDGKPAEKYFKDNWSQEEIFNKLSNNGNTHGVFMKDGQLYINATYIQTGKITDKNKKNYWDLDTGEFQLSSTATVGGNKIATVNETIKYVDVEYSSGNSSTVPPTSGWNTGSPEWEAGKYIWQRTVTTMADGSKNISDPTCIQGAAGENGESTTITTNIIDYAVSNSGTTPPQNWTQNIPSVTPGQFLWMRNTVKYSDGTSSISYGVSYQGENGENGDNGVGISSSSVMYQASDSGTAVPTGNWQQQVPEMTPGSFLWTRTQFSYTDGSTTTLYSVSYQGENGSQGIPGPAGEDGRTLYTWIKYADTPTSGMSDNPDGKKYLGISYNNESAIESTNYSDYQWSEVQGKDGVPGPAGEDGQTLYTWIKYATSASGANMSDSPDGRDYIGIAYNKTTPTESNSP